MEAEQILSLFVQQQEKAQKCLNMLVQVVLGQERNTEEKLQQWIQQAEEQETLFNEQ